MHGCRRPDRRDIVVGVGVRWVAGDVGIPWIVRRKDFAAPCAGRNHTGSIRAAGAGEGEEGEESQRYQPGVFHVG